MKKLLGISLVAVLAATPLMASADPISTITKKGTNGVVAANTAVATTSYVQGAYNDLAGHINTNIEAINANTSAIGVLNGSGEGSVAQKIAGNAANATFNAETNYTSGTIGYAIKNTSSEAIAGLDATASQTAATTGENANGGLNLSITEVDGVITAISGSIAANTYDAYGAASDALEAAETYASNGANLTDGTVAKSALATTVQASLDKADSAVQSVTEGTANGTVKVGNTDVAVHGLGSAAYTASTAYDAAGAANTAESNAKSYADQKLLTVYTTWDSNTTDTTSLGNTPAPVQEQPSA